MLKTALFDCAINKKCCSVDGGRGICPLFSSPPWGIWQLKSPHPRAFAIQGKKNANARGSARGGGGWDGLGPGGIDWCIMSSCVICVVIAREIFLLQSDCPATTKCITNLKTTIKTEILPLNVVDGQLVSVLFPVNVFRPKFAAASLRQICETRNLRVFFFFYFGFIFAACWIRT